MTDALASHDVMFTITDDYKLHDACAVLFFSSDVENGVDEVVGRYASVFRHRRVGGECTCRVP